MAKIKKNIMAWVLVLSMVSGMVAVPAHAAEEEKPNATVTVTVEDVTNAKNEVVGEKKTTQTDWSDSNTASNPGTPSTEGSTTTTVNGSVTTDVVGTETKEDKVVEEGNKIISSGSVDGEETTIITDTETTTTVTKGDVYSDEDGETVQTKDEAYEGESEYGDHELTDSTGWVEDKNSEANDEGKYKVDGDVTETEGNEFEVKIEEDLSNEVVLDMTVENKTAEVEREVYVSIEDVLKDNGIAYNEGDKLEDGSVVSCVYDENGKLVGYKFTAPEYDGDDEETIKTNKTGNLVPKGQPTSKKVKPEGYEVGITDITDENGNVIGSKEIAEIKDEDGNVIGYTITEKKVVGEEASTAETENENGEVTPIDPVLPVKPEAPAPVTKDGLTTTVTVEDLIEGGKHVGYTTITKVTDAQGNEVSWSSSSIYHTEYSKSSTIEKDPETEIETLTTVTEVYGVEYTQEFEQESEGTKNATTFKDVTEDVYQLVESEDGKYYFLYKGEIYEVAGTSSTGTGKFVEVSDATLNDYIANGGDLIVQGDKDYSGLIAGKYYSGWNPSTNKPSSGKWVSDGYGLFSDFFVTDTKKDEHMPRMFRMTDRNGQSIYVYCVEMGADYHARDEYYGSKEYQVEDGKENQAAWTGAVGTIGQLRSVAVNGFWGTDSGLGSLEAVKDLMRRNGLEAEAEKLTAGMALTATQVAIWEFGKKNNVGTFGEGFVSKDYETNKAPSAEDEAIIIALRDLLVDLAKSNDGSGQVDVITKDSVKGAGIVLQDKATDENGKEYYNGKVKFELDVSTSSLNGDMIVKVKVDGKEVAGARLAGEDGKGQFLDFIFGDYKIYPDENGVFTIENVPLYEGVNIDLELLGTQHLDDGIYIFEPTSGSWQNTVGLSTLDNDVNIKVGMTFEVEDPQDTLVGKNSSWTEKKTDVVAYKKTDTYNGFKAGTLTSEWETTNTKVIGTTTETTIVEKVTKLFEEWFSQYYEEETIPNNPPEEIVPFDLDHNIPRPLTNLPEEPVPLADAPKTGDEAVFVAILTVMAGIGLAVMKRKEEETA